MVYPANLLRAFANLFNRFFKAPLPDGGDNPEATGPPPSPKIPVIVKQLSRRS